ncbi:CCA tRNA nucleotidyltransferase [Domibacillus iocasae]|uniref:CCA-adding enzyme n=1 Tax=Domibacillus iocasae TaxID=1714016 RepID=A0A1E7DN46_9BACI|nr:CCA tRNA nucleotidyltransferase [Domibacillus iocasae]OES44506.1 CCA tRNA nucleotidyltransferase [Domibacillus iocasae]
MIDHPFFRQALPIVERLEASGYEAYFVGGAVRDLFLSRPIHDVDIATSATPSEVKSLFTHTVDVGIDHGTILVLHNGTGFEVTTFRIESEYSDFRRPDHVEFVRSLYEDLKRRDFTMNAMAMNKAGKWIDPFHGKDDMQKGIVRTVGRAAERFSEDALRMMRAARFVSQLSFNLDKETKKAMEEHAPLLGHIAVERKLNEIDKLLAGRDRRRALWALIETNLYRFLPGLREQKEAFIRLAKLPLEPLTVEQVWVVMAYLCANHDAAPFLKDWRLPQKRIKRIVQSIRTLKQLKAEGASDWLLFQSGLQSAVDAAIAAAVLSGQEVDLKEVTSRFESLPIKSRHDLAITGKELMEWADKPRGVWIKEVLERTEKAVIAGDVRNDRMEIERWLRTCNLL